MNEQEIRKFCDDFAYTFMASLVFDPEFENFTCKAVRKLSEGLKNSLLISIHKLIDEKEDRNET